MITMQTFYEWLSAAPVTNNAYRRHLSLLTRASRAQVLSVKTSDPWSIWWR